MAKKLQNTPMAPETVAKFKEKITEMHHDLLDLLNGYDVIWTELTDLEDMADKNLGTRLAGYDDEIARGLALADEELNK